MNLEIYKIREDSGWSTIHADLDNGKLMISGHDLGPKVEGSFGRSDYEYSLSLDEENTRKLFESLGCAEQPEADKLRFIKDHFDNSRVVSALKEYCKQHGIQSKFWCWY